jgi:hypothetical protein
MGAAIDMLEVEAQLEAAAGAASTSAQPAAVDSSSEAGLASAAASSNGMAAGGADAFYSSGKGGTWKAFKKMVKHKKEGSSEVRRRYKQSYRRHQPSTLAPSTLVLCTTSSIHQVWWWQRAWHATTLRLFLAPCPNQHLTRLYSSNRPVSSPRLACPIAGWDTRQRRRAPLTLLSPRRAAADRPCPRLPQHGRLHSSNRRRSIRNGAL